MIYCYACAEPALSFSDRTGFTKRSLDNESLVDK